MTKKEWLRRKRRKRQKRIITACVLLLMLVLLSAGLWMLLKSDGSESKDPAEEAGIENELDLSKRGRITGVINEAFEESYYSETDLKAMIEQEISDYNALSGDDKAVTMKDFSVEDQVASVSLCYQSDEDYRAFNNVELYVGKVSDLTEEGHLSPMDLTAYDMEENLAASDFDSVKKRRAVVTEEPGLIKTSGKILYHTENVEVIKDKLARVTTDEESGDTRAVIIYK